MFDIGWTELLIIAVVAIIVVGPKDLPKMLRSLGQYAAQLRRTAGEFRSQFDEAIRESELDELRSSLQDASDMNPINQIKDSVTESLAPLKDTADEIKSGMDIKEPNETPKSKEPEGASENAGKAKKTKAKAKTSASAEKSGD